MKKDTQLVPNVSKKTSTKDCNCKLWIAAIVGVLLLTTAGIYLVGALSTKKPIYVTGSPVLDPTANWKTYRNDRFKYEIKYPSEAQISSKDNKFTIQIRGEIYPLVEIAEVYILENIDGKSLPELGNETFATDAPEPYDLGWKELEFNGLSAWETYYEPPGDASPRTIYIFEHNGIIYSIWKATFNNGRQNDINDLSTKILSTFKLFEDNASCRPRPACLDASPPAVRCLMPETPDMCPKSSPTLGDAATKEECDLKNGRWQKWGRLGLEYCQIPVSDAGKFCTDGSQCSLGKCIAEDNSVPGKCQTYKNTFGCLSFVEDGIIGGGVCID